MNVKRLENFKLRYENSKLTAYWDGVEGTAKYLLEVKDLSSGEILFNQCVEAEGFAPPVIIAADGFAPEIGAKYGVSVFCVYEAGAYGEIEIHSKEEVLQTLLESLTEHAVDGCAVLCRDSLACHDFMKAEEVIAFFVKLFRTDTVKVRSAELPLKIEDESISVKGVADVLGGTFGVVFVIRLDSELALDVSVTIRPGEGWSLPKSFPELDESFIGYMEIGSPYFRAGKDGVVFGGKFNITSDLKPESEYNYTYEVEFSGPIDIDDATFSFAGSVSGNFNIALTDGGSVGITDCSVSLMKDGNGERYAVLGTTSFGGKNTAVSLSMTPDSKGQYELTSQTVGSFDKFYEFFNEINGGGHFSEYLPDSLMALSIIRLTSFKIHFSPQDNISTEYEYFLDINSECAIIPGVFTLKDISMTLRLFYTEYGEEAKLYELEAILKSTVLLKNGIAADVSVTAATDGDWSVEFTDKNNMPALSYLAGLIGSSADAVLGVFPDSLRSILTLSLKELIISFDPFKQSLQRIDFTIAQTNDWVIAPNVLALKNCELMFGFINSGDEWGISCSVTGELKIGSSEFTAYARFDSGADEFSVIASGEIMHIPSIGDILGFITGGSAALPSGIATFGAIDISELSVTYSISQNKITSVFFRIEQSEDWVIIENALSVKDFKSAFNIINGQSELYAIGFANGSVIVAENTDIFMSLEKHSIDADWVISAAPNDYVHLPGFSALAGYLQPESSQSYLPANLPLSKGIDFGGLILKIDKDTKSLKELSFGVMVPDVWTIIENRISLTDLYCRLNMPYPFEASKIYGVIGATLTLGAAFSLKGEKGGTDADWVFSGELAERVSFDFIEAANTVADGISLPADIGNYGFTPNIAIEEANLTVTPATGDFDFEGEVSFTWNYSFGKAGFSVLGIKAKMRRKNAVTGFSLRGDLSLGSISAYGLLEISNSTADTIVKAGLQFAEMGQIVDSIIGANAYSSLAVPAEYAKPSEISSLDIALNFSKNRLLVYGKYKQTAAIALKVEKTGEDYNFAVGAALSDFKFGDLSKALVGIDGVIGLNRLNAAVVLSTFETVTDVDISKEIAVLGKNLGIVKGLNFYIDLDFDGGLLKNIKAILDISGKFTIFGCLPSDPQSPVSLEASLSNMTLLSFLAFSDIKLKFTYGPDKAKKLWLTGGIRIDLGQTYYFNGEMLIDEKSGSFKVVTAQPVVKPLGIPFTLEKAGLDISIIFENGGLKSYSLSLFGQVELFGVVPLYAGIVMSDKKFRVVVVKLCKPDGTPASVSVKDLFKNVFDIDWPDILNISLYNGEIWYCPDADFGTYKKGFNASARTKIMFLPEIDISLAILDKYLTATAQFANPIDMFFVKFTGAGGAVNKGPYVALDTSSKTTPFTMGTGITLFSYNAGDVIIKIGSSKMEGTLRLNSIPVFGSASLSFEWSDDGFQLTEWPLDQIKLPDFDLKNITGTSACKQVIMNLMPIKTKFDLDADIKILPASGTKPATLRLYLKGKFDIVSSGLAYSSDPITTIDIGEIYMDFPFPGSFSFSDLANAFVTALAENIPGIIAQLFEKPEMAAKLLLIEGAEWAVGELVDYFVCKGFSKEFALSLVRAILSAVPVAFEIEGLPYIIGGALGVVVGGIFISAIKDPEAPSQEPDAPKAPTLSFDKNKLYIKWNTAKNAKYYNIILTSESGEKVAVSTTQSTQSEVFALEVGKAADFLTNVRYGVRYSASIVAINGQNKTATGASASLYILSKPNNLSPHYYCATNTIVLTFSPIANCGSYTAVLYDEEDNEITRKATSTASVSITHQRIKTDGKFKLAVFGTATNVTGPLSDKESINIYNFPKPEITGLINDKDTIKVSWTKISNAKSYTVTAMDKNMIPLKQETVFTESYVLDASALTTGQDYYFTVQAVADKVESACSDNFKLTRKVLAAPSVSQFIGDFDAKSLKITWSGVQASSYKVLFTDLSGEPLAVQPEITYDGESASLLADFDYSNARVLIRGEASDTIGYWSAPLAVKLMKKPANFRLEFSNDDIVGWWDAESTARYMFELYGPDGKPVIEPMEIVNGGRASISGNEYLFAEEFTYAANVYTFDGIYCSVAQTQEVTIPKGTNWFVDLSGDIAAADTTVTAILPANLFAKLPLAINYLSTERISPKRINRFEGSIKIRESAAFAFMAGFEISLPEQTGEIALNMSHVLERDLPDFAESVLSCVFSAEGHTDFVATPYNKTEAVQYLKDAGLGMDAALAQMIRAYTLPDVSLSFALGALIQTYQSDRPAALAAIKTAFGLTEIPRATAPLGALLLEWGYSLNEATALMRQLFNPFPISEFNTLTSVYTKLQWSVAIEFRKGNKTAEEAAHLMADVQGNTAELLCSVLAAVFNLYTPHKYTAVLARSMKAARFGLAETVNAVKKLYGNQWNAEDEEKINKVFGE